MYCETLLCFESVWFYEKKFGITINLLQIKLDMPILVEIYSFKDNSNSNNVYENDPQFKNYFKMIKMGIPKRVVIQKMILSNLDPGILDGKTNSNNVDKMDITNGKSTLKKVSKRKMISQSQLIRDLIEVGLRGWDC